MKEFYKKYVNVIVGTIFLLFMFKGCQACQRSSQLKWEKAKYESIVDSINNDVEAKDSIINCLLDSINMYKMMVKNEKDKNSILNEINKNQQENNRALVRTNEQLLKYEKSK